MLPCAPWGVDAAGQPVPVFYSITGNILTRTVLTSDTTQFPVITNFCIFGRNPNGSCCGSGVVKAVTDRAAGCVNGSLQFAGGFSLAQHGVAAAAGLRVVNTTPAGFWVSTGAGCLVGAARGW